MVAGARWFFPLLCLMTCPFSVGAQEQERKLVDRLLRPDLTLVNSAQDRKFTGPDITPVEKKVIAKLFHSGRERTARRFSGGKDFPVKQFETKEFGRAQGTAHTRANAEVASAKAEFVAGKSSLVRTSADEGKIAKTRDYGDSRPFLAKGTRQKNLSQEDKPLTIDEIRELLNKNK
jgi:hypothetical protein